MRLRLTDRLAQRGEGGGGAAEQVEVNRVIGKRCCRHRTLDATLKVISGEHGYRGYAGWLAFAGEGALAKSEVPVR